MSLYAIISNSETNTAAQAAAARAFAGKVNQWSPTVTIVAGETSAKSISDKLDLPEGVRGGTFIVQLAPDYFGFSSKAFWDWLRDTFQADANV